MAAQHSRRTTVLLGKRDLSQFVINIDAGRQCWSSNFFPIFAQVGNFLYVLKTSENRDLHISFVFHPNSRYSRTAEDSRSFSNAAVGAFSWDTF